MQYPKGNPRIKGSSLMLMDEASRAVSVIPADSISQVLPVEARAGEDLRRHLDATRRADGSQSVTLRLSPGSHDLTVTYLVPSPTWRVSYRVIAEADETKRAGRLLLQGWGLVDNRFGEDLDNVHLSLVAGQPISFIYDLSTSRVPERRKVNDVARVAAGPVEYASESRTGGR